MLKARVVGVLPLKGGTVVQTINFKKYLPIGVPSVAIEYLNRWGIDEIMLFDIEATLQGRKPDFTALAACAASSQVPLLFGGGISTVFDIERIIQAGFEKISINTAGAENPKLITEGAYSFGSQCIVAAIDVCAAGAGRYEVYTHCGTKATGISPCEAARRAEDCGAGEIFLCSIDRDGTKLGYDLELIRSVVRSVSIPVIVCGGAGHPRHFVDALAIKVAAVAAGNYFHYTEHSVIAAKRYIRSAGIPVRLDSYATYEDCEFDECGRMSKRSDAYLDRLRFEYIDEEVI